jgi:cysteinyl-tRNA synthetase
LGDLGEAVSALAAELSVPTGRPVDSLLDDILTLRNQARQQRDFAKADLIRDRLGLIGVAVEDTADGARWSRR